MSQKEVDRLEIMQRLSAKQMSQLEASKILGLGTRQVRRLQRSWGRFGGIGLTSKRRGKASNNQLPSALKRTAVSLITERYRDFGPTLAHEKLSESHGLKLSVESTRKLMIQSQLWHGKSRKRIKTYQMRSRRACFGELVQIDGSPHRWFETRGPDCCLLVFIDDATGRIMQLHFEPEESTQGYFDAVKKYIAEHGRPLTFYSDKHNIFRVNIPEAQKGTGETQFGRAMRELDIKIICAHSPQAKGRVERANGILQDRLIKEMRLRGINDIQTANAFLPEFIKNYNQRFAVQASDPTDTHRRTLLDQSALDFTLSYQYERTLSKNLELSFRNTIYQVQSATPGYTMRGGKVRVYLSHGEVKLHYKGQFLAYKTFNKNSYTPPPIVSRKEISRHIPQCTSKPKANHPWRRYNELKTGLSI